MLDPPVPVLARHSNALDAFASDFLSQRFEVPHFDDMRKAPLSPLSVTCHAVETESDVVTARSCPTWRTKAERRDLRGNHASCTGNGVCDQSSAKPALPPFFLSFFLSFFF